MTDLIVQPKFESLATRTNSKGEECYDEHTIADALGLPFRDLKDISRRLLKANDISGEGISVTVSAGFTTKEVDSFLYNLDDTKLIVTQSGGKHAVAFCRYLIQRDKKLDQTTQLIGAMMKDETICRRVLALADEQQQKLIAERDGLKGRMGQIAETREASAMATASHLTQYIKKNGLPVPKYAKTFEPEVDESKIEELANKKATDYMKAAQKAAYDAKAELREVRQVLANREKDLNDITPYILMKQKEQRMASVSPNWPTIEWRARPELLKSWGIDTAAPGQDGWKQFTVFCRGLHPDLNRYNSAAVRSEMRLDLAEKFKLAVCA